jgi:predicted transposase YbfD/YdcC
MEFLSGIPDPRRTDRGDFKYPLPDIMVMLCLGRLCGRVSRRDIISFTEAHLATLQSRLGILEKGCPSEPTLCRLEKGIDPDAMAMLYAALAAKSLLPMEDGRLRMLAMDGKYARGTTLADGRCPDIVTLYSPDDGIALGTEMCEEKSNEIKAGPKLLDTVDISGTLVTADAMSCQKEIVSAIREHGADYLIGLKANQKSLLWDAEDNLAKLAPDDRYLPPVTLEHGRIENRKCLVYRNLEGIRTAGDWKDLRAIIRIDVHKIDKRSGKTSDETRFYITSLTGNAETLHGYTRKHWAIENNLHWTLDTSLRQDAIKRKHKEAARNLDTVQKTVLLLLNVAMRRHPPVGGKGKCSLADVRRKAADSIDYAIEPAGSVGDIVGLDNRLRPRSYGLGRIVMPG